MHTLPKTVVENLHITAKIVCYPKALERKETGEPLEAFYPDSYPVQPKSLDKLIEDALKFLSTQMNRGGRVVIMTNEYSRVGSTLAMAYLIAGEGKSLKEAWATLRKAYLALRPRWEFLERLAAFEQKVKNLCDPAEITDEDFL
uniref:Serine:threonine:tyrosine interacting n=2 Tax=Echinococcus granulosus TaxID=6210 RepID=A0A068WHC9_ECHGR|nr:serine:threonine:tyrosine interacting [Echinococcus granulosus]